ncbi:hypothetical protein XNC1_1088 [Xenorhabdus nematophila ATCC 19061]|uniref:Uncharacterized protein n=1 Tax=Xenorhabdus nematophila (strain ATCC 19061 / DSM 3370 / CCUG 14189 / LMG 1036 / NCIMB 9965 / AN6) TaxID=406817 RepID=D3V8W1_XENNA|nr:hypothetical protein XNC1_1088 [Xenorhabdus nematophila ATCC 19061]
MSFSLSFSPEYSCDLAYGDSYEAKEEVGTTRLLRYSAASCGVTGGIFSMPIVGGTEFVGVSVKALFPKLVNKSIPKQNGI